MKTLTTILICLLCPLLVWADVEIPLEYRIQNQVGELTGDAEPGATRPLNRANCCMWAASETIFYGAAGYEAFKGLYNRTAADRVWWRGAMPANLTATLDRDKIPYEVIQPSDWTKFRKVCDDGLGCVLFIPGHAVALIGMDDREVRIIDNGPNRSIQRRSLGWFRANCELGICPSCPAPNFPFPRQPSPQQPNRPGPRPAPPPEVVPTTPAPTPTPGPAGPKGDTGPQGPKGDKGDPGATIPDEVLVAQINRLLEKMALTCELYDADNKLIATTTFGPNKPLKIKLVPVKVAAPN